MRTMLRVIVEGVPLNAPNLFVKVNGSVISPAIYIGHKVPVTKETTYGKISGEIVILPVSHGTTKTKGIEMKKGEAHVLNLTRLITQEITMMKDPPRDPRKAFERQSRLLRDAFKDKE